MEILDAIKRDPEVFDCALELAASIAEETTSWGLSPTKAEVAKSTQRAIAKFIRVQKSDSPERSAFLDE